MTDARRDYGTGSVYQRTSDNRWVGTIEHGWNAAGKRRRITVTGKTEAQVKRKLRDKRRALDTGQDPASSRVTVKTWAEQYLAMRVLDLSPKAYRAAESPIQNWVIPTIGRRRLADLTPGDVRAVHDACRQAGRGVADVHRALHTMLTTAQREGHQVSQAALAMRAPKAAPSDRAAMSVDEGLACLKVAAELPHGTRWLMTLLYGLRQGEALGLTWDAIDFTERPGAPYGEFRIEWQLQALPYVDRAEKRRGFRIPDGYECRHLVDAWHLVRPKSAAGYRVGPLLEPVRNGLETWRSVAPSNPWGLVWPAIDGTPANSKRDEEEWGILQETVGITHPTRTRKDRATGEQVPAGFYVHECRNFAATMLLDAEVPEHVVTDLLGHSSVATSLRYRTKRREPLHAAMTRVGERLQLG